MRIALFTPYSPEIGGGSVQLRSHLAQLPELNVEWYYLAPSAVAGEHRHWLGKPLAPGQFVSDLAARSGFLPGSTAAVRKIADQLDADVYWIVAHYEGISVAAELLARGKPVHLTVHDDPVAMLIRSRRFRALLPLLARVFSRALRAAKSVDVTSTNMRDYLNKKYEIRSFALYRHVPQLPEVNFRPCDETLVVGHIGTLYHPDPFRQFVLACRDCASAQKRSLKIVRIGSSPQIDKIASEKLATFENHGELPEIDALPILATCDFVYAMYPHGFRYRGFRRTSLPIKLSTYIQAQRPIFAHSPEDSGLAQLVAKFNVGKVCSGSSRSVLGQAIREILSTTIPRANFEALRRELMGDAQLRELHSALISKSPG